MVTYLLNKATNGKYRFVKVFTDEEWHEPEHGYIIQRSYGQVGGKETLSPTIIIKQTKQKRTWREQLELQYNSEVKKFLDKGYKQVEQDPNTYTLEELDNIYGTVTVNQFGIIKPMLAKVADKVTNPKIFDKEWIASRKINGVRSLFYFDKEIHTSSRGGGHYDYATVHLRNNPILKSIFKKYPNVILDGELYKHGKSLQEISGAARLEKNAYDCEWLELWIYDCIFMDKLDTPAKDRIKFLEDIAKEYNLTFDPNNDDFIKIVPQEYVSGRRNIDYLHEQFVNEGFEGLVIRDPDRPYKPNGRTNDMIKIKHYKDMTIKVIDYDLGLRGSEDMCFICEMKDGRTFKAMPIGDRSVKEEYVANFSKYKDQFGDCKYFELSKDGIPCQPKFLAFRYDTTY